VTPLRFGPHRREDRKDLAPVLSPRRITDPNEQAAAQDRAWVDLVRLGLHGAGGMPSTRREPRRRRRLGEGAWQGQPQMFTHSRAATTGRKRLIGRI